MRRTRAAGAVGLAVGPLATLAALAALAGVAGEASGDPLPTSAEHVATPGRSVASDDTADAIVLNPANLAWLPGAELRWTLVNCPDDAIKVGCGNDWEAATPLPFGLATGLRVDLVQPPWGGPDSEGIGFPYRGSNYAWVTWAAAIKLWGPSRVRVLRSSGRTRRTRTSTPSSASARGSRTGRIRTSGSRRWRATSTSRALRSCSTSRTRTSSRSPCSTGGTRSPWRCGRQVGETPPGGSRTCTTRGPTSGCRAAPSGSTCRTSGARSRASKPRTCSSTRSLPRGARHRGARDSLRRTRGRRRGALRQRLRGHGRRVHHGIARRLHPARAALPRSRGLDPTREHPVDARARGAAPQALATRRGARRRRRDARLAGRAGELVRARRGAGRCHPRAARALERRCSARGKTPAPGPSTSAPAPTGS